MGRFEGIVVFVSGTAPQERVRARVTAQKLRFWEAELVEILQASPYRRQAPCPVFGRCGGCSWQHIEYSQQIEQKKKILVDALRSLKKLGEFEWREFLAAPSEFAYRNRIQVHIQNGRYGFYSSGTRDLVPVTHCLIAEAKINERLQDLRCGEESRIEIARLESGEVELMRGARDPEAAIFSQVNSAQNEILKKSLLEQIIGSPEWLMDLYAGSGNLTRPLVERFATSKVIAVEMSRNAVARGRKSLPKVEWISGDVEIELAKISRPSGKGCVVLDPPRTGVGAGTVENLIHLAPQQILYVSCNPTTFARDAERLVRSGRYKVHAVQGIDMFPQTEHVELIASLCAAT